jgi:hypothetical protein
VPVPRPDKRAKDIAVLEGSGVLLTERCARSGRTLTPVYPRVRVCMCARQDSNLRPSA